MKRKYNIAIIAVFVFIFILLVWYLFCPLSYKFGDCQHKNTAYVAAGALFTALAFVGTIITILYQYNTELRKTSLGVYQIIYSGMMADPKFNNALNYLLENKDLQKTKSQLEDERVPLTQNVEISNTLPGEAKKIVEVDRYNILIYFCDKMEYIGILITENNLDISLLYTNGSAIISAFRVLERWSFFKGKNRQKYIHFRYLVHFIERENNNYIKHCNSIERKIRLDEWKNKIKDLFCCIFGIGL